MLPFKKLTGSPCTFPERLSIFNLLQPSRHINLRWVSQTTKGLVSEAGRLLSLIRAWLCGFWTRLPVCIGRSGQARCRTSYQPERGWARTPNSRTSLQSTGSWKRKAKPAFSMDLSRTQTQLPTKTRKKAKKVKTCNFILKNVRSLQAVYQNTLEDQWCVEIRKEPTFIYL